MRAEEYLIHDEDEEANMREAAPSILESTTKMSLLAVLSRVSGFLRNIALAYALGSSVLSDSYSTANMMPNFIYEMVAGGILSSVFIPVYMQYLQEKSEDETRFMISNLASIVFVWAGILSLIGAVFSPQIVRLITIGDPSHATPTMIMFFRVFAIQIVFYAMSAVFAGVLNSHRKFVLPALVSAINNIVVIGIILGIYVPLSATNHDLALFLLACGTTFGVAIMAFIQIPSVFKAGISFKPHFNLSHPAVGQVLRLGLPMLAYSAIWQVCNIIIYMLLQSHNGGSMAYMQALAFSQLPYAIFTLSVSTAIFPELVRYANSKNYEKFKDMLSMGLRTTSFIMIPASAYIWIMSKPIIILALEHGKFDSHGTELTSGILSFFAIALLSMAFHSLLNMAFYSQQDTKTPLVIIAVVIPLQIALNIVLVNAIGEKGIPVGAAISLTVGVLLQYLILRRKMNSLETASILFSMAKHVLAVIPAAAMIYAVHQWCQGLNMDMYMRSLIDIAATFVLGSAVYLVVSALLRTQEMRLLITLIKRIVGERLAGVDSRG
jgi:putative peptidoglycan lipid II flippase